MFAKLGVDLPEDEEDAPSETPRPLSLSEVEEDDACFQLLEEEFDLVLEASSALTEATLEAGGSMEELLNK